MPRPGAGTTTTARRTGTRIAATVAALAFLGGIGAGAVVRPLGAVPQAVAATSPPSGIADREAAARSAARPDAAGTDAASGAGTEAGTDAGAGPGTPVIDGAALSGAVPVAAASTTDTSALDAAAADVRPIPVPELLPRDAVGPLWLTPADREAGLLALDVPESASGVLDVVPGSTPAPGASGVRTVRVEVEHGLPVDGAAFAGTVMTTLNDTRGWGAGGDLSFARTDGPADLRVVLASPDLVDALCAPLDTGGQVSCGRNGHAVLNFRRWVLATGEFSDKAAYRQYLVNHEVGHLLGHGHLPCPGAGQPAPLMQQQSIRVAPCLPNGWPFP